MVDRASRAAHSALAPWRAREIDVMPMKHAGNQVELGGDHLFFFRSPKAGVTDCLLLGHGGWKESDGEFNVPVGRTLTFYVEHLKPLRLAQDLLVMGGEVGVTPAMATRIAGPGESHNYVLAKALGTTGAHEGKPVDYVQLAEAMNKVATKAWCPHVVTVRNRGRKHATIAISVIIDAVIAHMPAITNFYYGACREKRP
jgi:hypothetical protein